MILPGQYNTVSASSDKEQGRISFFKVSRQKEHVETITYNTIVHDNVNLRNEGVDEHNW